MRFDSLALLLNLANISYSSRVLLVENTSGFLTGCLLEKQVHSILRVEFEQNNNGQPKFKNNILAEFNLGEADKKKVKYSYFKDLNSSEKS